MFYDHDRFERAAAHMLHAIGGGRGGRGRYGAFGGGSGGGWSSWGGGFGGGDMPGGRKLGAVDLQMVILALLAERPAHGYDLIKTLEERSGGFYSPSPGVIYPALSYLHDVGHATVALDGARKLYSITEEGRAHLAANGALVQTILDALARIGGRMDQVREAFAGVGDQDGASDEVHRARRTLKEALRRKHGCDLDEARRIAAILDRAAAEIRGD